MASFTTFWSRDRYLAAQKHAPAGFRFGVLFGGPHVSLPSFRRARVKPGDWVYPIHVHAGALHILGRMRVRALLDLADWQRQDPATAGDLGKFDLSVSFDPPPSQGPRVMLHFLAPTCTDEVVTGEEGTPFLPDLIVPPERLADIRYNSQRGERPIKHVVDGKVKATVSLQGNYRLSQASAEMFAGWMESHRL